MSSALKIRNPGGQSLITDLGRPGHRHLGVPHSGAADRHSHQIANWLVGNAPTAATIETAMGGLSVRFLNPTHIALCGADLDATLDDRSFPLWQSVEVKPDHILTLRAPRLGVRTYLAVAGGIDGAAHFGSVSTYAPAHLGANAGRLLAKNTQLKTGESHGEPSSLPAAFIPKLANHITLRARSVSEYERLSATAQRRLFVSPFTASTQTSRMGARLDTDEPLELIDDRQLISSPLPLGTLQVPPDGRPILSLIDGHCTGGYARALRVIASEVWLMGQIGPGTRISFNRCFADDAPDILQRHLATWTSLIPGYRI